METYGVDTAETPYLDNKRSVIFLRLNLLPTRHTDVVKTSLTNVALTSPYSSNENVGRRCKNDIVATCYKDNATFATSSDLSIAII